MSLCEQKNVFLRPQKLAATSCFIAELTPVSRCDWSTQEPISDKLLEQFKLDLLYFLS